jgi:hypothetical protein
MIVFFEFDVGSVVAVVSVFCVCVVSFEAASLSWLKAPSELTEPLAASAVDALGPPSASSRATHAQRRARRVRLTESGRLGTGRA